MVLHSDYVSTDELYPAPNCEWRFVGPYEQGVTPVCLDQVDLVRMVSRSEDKRGPRWLCSLWGGKYGSSSDLIVRNKDVGHGTLVKIVPVKNSSGFSANSECRIVSSNKRNMEGYPSWLFGPAWRLDDADVGQW